MPKAKFALLVVLSLFLTAQSLAQDAANTSIRVAVVSSDLSLKNVPKYKLLVSKGTDDKAPESVSTSFDGVAALRLAPGDYVVRSAEPLNFEGKTYRWERAFVVSHDHYATVELSNDNAKIEVGSEAKAPGKRRISEVAEMFPSLRNGVVTVEGELGIGSGFIFDDRGLIITNHRFVAETNDVRVRFDRSNAVRARVLLKDEARDIAILQINMSAFKEARSLPLASVTAAEPAVVVGENIFSIGSPANQDKILTTGIVSKIEDKAIISDITFAEGSAGGPLFNSLGEVVGVTTFRVTEKDGSGLKKEEKATGLAGTIRLEVLQDLIEKARTLAAGKGLPSAEKMPNVPDGTFPVETIKSSLRSKEFSAGNYISDVKDYQVRYMTPVYKFYMIEKDRIESLKIRQRRNKDKGRLDTNDMFKDLSIWNEYAGELKPVVDVLALPETTVTGKSLALSAITNLTIGYSTPFDHKYKADFAQMKLLCDGKEVTPVRRSKTEISRDLQNYYKTKKRFTYAGVYSYPYEVFKPGGCTQMELHVFSEEDYEKPIVTPVTEAIKNRIWNDFSDFRRKEEAAN